MVACVFVMTGTLAQGVYTLHSPNGSLTLQFLLDGSGAPHYSLSYKNKPVLQKSSMGFQLAEGDLTSDFVVLGTDTASANEHWQPVWGEVKEIRNQYRQLTVHLKKPGTPDRLMDINFRLFNDGLGFRYGFPLQQGLQYFIVTDERTQFVLTGNHKAFWIPGDYDTNEYAYSTTNISAVDGKAIADNNPEIAVRVVKDPSSVATPLMMKTADGLYINIHEASLINYPAMQLHVNKGSFILTSSLVPDPVGNKAYLRTPFATPWRTVLVSDKAADILSSKTILNLNEPSRIKDVSWIKPYKMVGVWWEMHINKSTWDYAGTQAMGRVEDYAKVNPTGKHGATTANTKRYIDFAAKNGIDAVLVEGWNVGWEDWFGKWKEDVFDFLTPYPDYDVQELHRYAASKGVKIVMHHETSGSVTNYERYMDKAYDFMNANGYESVKTGYVGRIIPRGEFHDGQWMINHFNRVAEKTAAHHITVDMHESVRPTGLYRTYPNWLACEAARGNEFNAWSKGNPPEHETILPFTRLMGGPMDYTPGIFQIKLDMYGKKDNAVHTTLAKQLALYVVMFSPLQMAADLPENYEAHLDAFQFIRDVALDWDDSRVLEAEPGDYVTIARKAKGTEKWFLGAITDESKHTSSIPLNFLTSGQKYLMTVYRDGEGAHWDTNPMAYKIERFWVDAKSVLKLNLAEGGGCAVSMEPATTESLKGINKYK